MYSKFAGRARPLRWHGPAPQDLKRYHYKLYTPISYTHKQWLDHVTPELQNVDVEAILEDMVKDNVLEPHILDKLYSLSKNSDKLTLLTDHLKKSSERAYFSFVSALGNIPMYEDLQQSSKYIASRLYYVFVLYISISLFSIADFPLYLSQMTQSTVFRLTWFSCSSNFTRAKYP